MTITVKITINNFAHGTTLIEIPLHLQLNVGSDSLSSSSRVRVGTSLRTLRGGARDRVLRRVKAGFHPIVKA